MCGVTLLARRLAVRLQDSVDEGNQWPQHRPLAFRQFALWRLCVSQSLAHHSAMHSKLAPDTFYRPQSELVFPSNLLK
jgi:hypothetical protein